MGCPGAERGKGLSGADGEALTPGKEGSGTCVAFSKSHSTVKRRGCLIPKSCEAFIKADQITPKGYCARARNAARFASIKTNEQSSR